MAKTRDRAKQKKRRASARQRAKDHSTFERTAIKAPAGVEFFQLKEGVQRIDILEYKVGKGNPHAAEGEFHYERTYYTHRAVGPNEDMVVCLRKTFKKACPICDYRAALQKKPDGDEEMIKSLAPKERQLFNIIDLDDKDKGVQLFELSFHLFGKLLDEKVGSLDEGDSDEGFAYLDEGKTLRISSKEKKFAGNKFKEVTVIDFKDRRNQYDEDEMEDKIICLDELPVEMPYKKLKELFLQTGDEDKDGDDDRDDDDDDDSDEDSDDGDSDEDDDPPPKKKKKSPPKDEDEDDDEEDDDDPPPKKKKKTPPKDEEDDDSDDDEPPKKKKTEPKFKVGDKVENDEHGTCSVVHVSTDGTSLRIEDEDGDIHRAIDADDCELIPPKKKKPPKDGEDDEDDEPASKPKKKKREVSFDDDDDEPVDTDDEEDDDDPPPKKKKKTSSKN